MDINNDVLRNTLTKKEMHPWEGQMEGDTQDGRARSHAHGLTEGILDAYTT